jgi:hypothetical protein
MLHLDLLEGDPVLWSLGEHPPDDVDALLAHVVALGDLNIRARIFKRIWSPGIDSKE